MMNVGYAFGGGGARGLAHIGILRALRSRPELLPNAVAGTSAGSIVAALYAAGISQERLESEVHQFEWFKNVVDLPDTLHSLWTGNRAGLVSNAALAETMNELLDGRGFNDLDVDLALTASDLQMKRRYIFTSAGMAASIDRNRLEAFLPPPSDGIPGCETVVVGDMPDVGKAVRASCAIPGIFMPVEIDGVMLYDGGTMDQVPVDVVKAMGCDVTVGISLALSYYPQHITGPASVLSAMIGVLGIQQLRRSLESADIGFQIRGIESRSVFNSRQFDLMDMGERDMNVRIPDLERLIGWPLDTIRKSRR